MKTRAIIFVGIFFITTSKATESVSSSGVVATASGAIQPTTASMQYSSGSYVEQKSSPVEQKKEGAITGEENNREQYYTEDSGDLSPESDEKITSEDTSTPYEDRNVSEDIFGSKESIFAKKESSEQTVTEKPRGTLVTQEMLRPIPPGRKRWSNRDARRYRFTRDKSTELCNLCEQKKTIATKKETTEKIPETPIKDKRGLSLFEKL